MPPSDNHRIEPRLLKGFRDTLPDRLLARNQLIQLISQTLTTFGFLPLETPTLEYAEILEGKLGDEGEKLLYKFVDHGGRQVAMRYDFTVPLARVAAQYPDLLKPFKRYQVGPVWRADNTQRGRYREFYQFDMDIVGSDSIIADAEILVLMQDILVALGISTFTIRVNDREGMLKVATKLKLDHTQQKIFFTGLDKYDKIGNEGVHQYWHDQGLEVFKDKNYLEVIESMGEFKDKSQRLYQVLHKAEALGLRKDYYQVDPTIVRGLDYYTGIVFETILTDAPEFGSIFSGGRYDGLVGRFAKQPIPAVGASVGLDRLMSAMEELGLLPEAMTTTQVFVTVFNSELVDESLTVAHALRQGGIATETSYQAGGLGKQLKLAAAKGVPYVIIVGPDEAKNNQVVLRNLASGQEQKLTTNQAIEVLKRN